MNCLCVMTLYAKVMPNMSYIHRLKMVSFHETAEGPLAVNILQVSWGQVVVRRAATLRKNTETLRRT